MFARRIIALAFALSAVGCSPAPADSDAAAVASPDRTVVGEVLFSSESVVVSARVDETVEPPRISVTNGDPGGTHAFPEGARPLTEPIQIELLSGSLPEEVAIDFKLGQPIAPGAEVSPFIAYLDEVDDRWVPVPTSFDADTMAVSAIVDHLSWWRVWEWDWLAFGEDLVSTFADLTRIENSDVSVPACPKALLLTTVNSIRFESLGAADVVLTCLGHSDETTAVVGITNNRVYPIETSVPHPARQLPGGDFGSWNEQIVDIVNGYLFGTELIPPAGTAFFEVPLDPSSNLAIRFDVDASSHALASELLLRVLKSIGGDLNAALIEAGISCVYNTFMGDTTSYRDAIDVVLSCAKVAYEKAGMQIPGLAKVIGWIKAGNLGVQAGWDIATAFGIGPIGTIDFNYNAPALSSDDSYVGTVTWVEDGDTFCVALDRPPPPGTRSDRCDAADATPTVQDWPVRLIGIDTPELTPSLECYASEATAALRSLVEGKTVRLELDPGQQVDDTELRRILAYVWLDGELVNDTMVRGGYAREAHWFPGIGDVKTVRYRDRLVAAQEEARSAGRGLWTACETTEPTTTEPPTTVTTEPPTTVTTEPPTTVTTEPPTTVTTEPPTTVTTEPPTTEPPAAEENQPPIAEFIMRCYGDLETVVKSGETLPIWSNTDDPALSTVFLQADDPYWGYASSDPDGEIVSFRWVVDGGTVGYGPSIEFDASSLADGDHPVTLFVTDDDGATSHATGLLRRTRG